MVGDETVLVKGLGEVHDFFGRYMQDRRGRLDEGTGVEGHGGREIMFFGSK